MFFMQVAIKAPFYIDVAIFKFTRAQTGIAEACGVRIIPDGQFMTEGVTSRFHCHICAPCLDLVIA